MRKSRMISAEVLESGAFCALPLGAQALYVHMQLYADDDGVVANERLPMLSCGATAEDLDALIEARFLLRAGRVLVIKHWWLHNNLARAKHNTTKWLSDMDGIFIREDRVYTEHEGPDRMPFREGLGHILGL